MKRLSVILILTVLFACNSSDDPICCTNIDINVSIKYLNSEGENLIALGEYVESNIQIYHRIDGDWERYYQGNLDYPKGIRLDEFEDGSYLTLFPSTTTNAEGISETKIEFSASDFDILRAEVDRANGNEIITKVWYNDVLKWEGPETERRFEVIK